MFSAIVYLKKLEGSAKTATLQTLSEEQRSGFSHGQGAELRSFFADFLWQGNVDTLAACKMQSLIIRSWCMGTPCLVININIATSKL